MLVSMTWLDYVIVTLLLASVGFGLWRGFLREVISLVSLFLSVVLAISFAGTLSGYFTWWQSEGFRYAMAFIAILVGMLLLGMVFGRVLSTVIKSLGLGVFDHVLGAVFGLLRAGAIIVVMLLLINATSLVKYPWYRQSTVAPIFQVAVNWLDGFLPKKLQHWHKWKKPSVKHSNVVRLGHHLNAIYNKSKIR